MRKTALASSTLLLSALLLSACNKTTGSVTDGMSSSSSSEMSSSDAMSSDAMSSDASSSSVDSSVTGEARVIEVSVSDWEFAPNAITVKKGEKVVLRLKDTDGTHSFLSADLGINVPISEGETKDVTIPTDTAGTFSFRCGVPCGPGHMDMKGTIVVE